MARGTHKPGVRELAEMLRNTRHRVQAAKRPRHKASDSASNVEDGTSPHWSRSEDLALLNDLEDRIDLEAAREAVEEYDSVGKR